MWLAECELRAGRLGPALETARRALAHLEANGGAPAQLGLARWGLSRVLDAMGSHGEARRAAGLAELAADATFSRQLRAVRAVLARR